MGIMDEKQFDSGLICGRVMDKISGGPLVGATAILTSVLGQTDSGNLRLYDVSGKASDTVSSDPTDSDGRFALGFKFEVLQVTTTMEFDPFFHMSVIGPSHSADQPTAQPYTTERITDQRLYQVVSLRRVADGLIPDWRNVTSVLKDIGNMLANTALDLTDPTCVATGGKLVKLPKGANVSFFKIMRPSPEYYGLLGYVEVILCPLLVAWGTGDPK
jgi:hypothetical protein